MATETILSPGVLLQETDNTLVFQAENGRDLFFKENSDKYMANYFLKD